MQKAQKPSQHRKPAGEGTAFEPDLGAAGQIGAEIAGSQRTDCRQARQSKRSLPDSHTDFPFAVAAEEFGIILCLALLALFSFVVIRALSRAYATEDMFARFAASGLAILFGVQAAINMSVNLHLIPAKGMTLPFISYGGSSIISLAYGVGMMLALTRQRPRTEMESIGDANAARSYA